MSESFDVTFDNFSLFARLNALCDELIKIAVERFLDNFNDDIVLFTCRKSISKMQYQKPEPGDIF